MGSSGQCHSIFLFKLLFMSSNTVDIKWSFRGQTLKLIAPCLAFGAVFIYHIGMDVAGLKLVRIGGPHVA